MLETTTRAGTVDPVGDQGHTIDSSPAPFCVAFDSRTKELLLPSIEIAPGDRDSWLAAACPDDPLTLAHVRALLDADAAAVADLLQRARLATRALQPVERIGPYVLVHPLGQGDFSEVHLEPGTISAR